MEADLRSLLDKDSQHGLSAAKYFRCVDVEVALAQSFAAVMNVLATQRPQGKRELEIRLLFPAFESEKRESPAAWSRGSKDDFARCADRALSRVYPPIDPLCFLGEGSPCFTERKEKGAVSLVATFLFCPLTRVMERGSVAYVAEAAEGPPQEPNLPSFLKTTGLREAFPSPLLPSQHNDGSVARDEDDRSAADEDLWRRARASRLDTAFLDGLASSPLLSTEEAQHLQEKCVKLVRRFARHVTERMVNENNWAVPQAATASNTTTTAHSTGRKGRTAHGSLYVPFLTKQASGTLRYKSVLEAASAYSRRGPNSLGSDGVETKTARHGTVHADVRGMEFTGLVVARSARFAYVGCRSGKSDAKTGAMVLVARVAIPSWLPATAATQTIRKRGRDGSAPNLALQALASRFDNLEEATLHDDLLDFVDLTAQAGEEPALVDIRAHRVLAKVNAATHKVTLWFEDAFIVGRRAPPVDSDETSSFQELMELVNASCARYIAERTKLLEGWRSMKAEEREDARQQAERLKARQQEQRRMDGTANLTETQDDERNASRTASLDGEGGSDNASEASASAVAAEVALMSAQERAGDDDSDEGKAARLHRQQTLRLFAAVNALMKGMMDPTVAAFAKTRASNTAPGRAAPKLPEIKGCRDIEALEEGPLVEFKYALRAKGTATTANTIMDAQRLRNTMAAMAGTLGGILCVGVADNGVVVGQPQGEVRAALRVSGFCPAMANAAVTLRDVRVLDPHETLGGPAEATRTTMPKDWWKTPTHSLLSAAEPASAASATKEQRVVTIISVAKGAAPFYASGRSALPYIRGCASTTPMPIRVMCDRIFNELLASASL